MGRWKYCELTEEQKQKRRESCYRWRAANKERTREMNIASREKNKAHWKSLTKEYVKEANKKARDKRKMDPEKRAQWNEHERLYREKQRRDNGVKEKPFWREWKNNNPEDFAQWRRSFTAKLADRSGRETPSEVAKRIKREVFIGYGGKCACCGEAEMPFLTLDHVNNDGAKLRKSRSHPSGGIILYAYLLRNKLPPGFQVLCWNCNIAKYHNGGICPHQMAKNTPDLEA